MSLYITKEYLETEYAVKRRSSVDIANELKTAVSTITRKLEKFGIPVRDKNDIMYRFKPIGKHKHRESVVYTGGTVNHNRGDDPVLTLLLEDIKANMDLQIKSARAELEETRQINAELKLRLGNDSDKWSKYEIMPKSTAYDNLRLIKERTIVDQLDDIAAEG